MRGESCQGGGVRRVAGKSRVRDRHCAAGRRSSVRFRAQLRRVGALSRSRPDDGRTAGLDDQTWRGVRGRSIGGLREHPAVESEGTGCRNTQDDAAAGGRDQDHLQRSAGDRHRAGQSAGRLCAAIRFAGRLHPARDVVHCRDPERGRRRRRSSRGGVDRLHGGRRHWRRHGQQLLLRTIRLARRRLHVQRCVGRLVRRPRGCPRGLVRQPRGCPRGLPGPSGRPGGRAWRARGHAAGTTDRAAAEPTEQSGSAGPAGAATKQTRKRRARRSSSAGAATYESRGKGQGERASGERSGTRSDAFSGYSSGRSERAASSRGQRSRGSARGGGRRR